MNSKDLHIYNSLTSSKEKFKPLKNNRVGMYVCGPTVYSDVHLGNCRTFISFDVIFRYLSFLGFNVRYVRNITDVGHLEDSGEDKISKKAKIEQLEPMEIAQKYTNSFKEVLKKFNVLNPSIEPVASGHITEQISIIEDSQQYRQEKDIVTIDYIPKIEEKEDQEPKRIVPKNDNKQKSLFEF